MQSGESFPLLIFPRKSFSSHPLPRNLASRLDPQGQLWPGVVKKLDRVILSSTNYTAKSPVSCRKTNAHKPAEARTWYH
jgi:hypothetical protein